MYIRKWTQRSIQWGRLRWTEVLWSSIGRFYKALWRAQRRSFRIFRFFALLSFVRFIQQSFFLSLAFVHSLSNSLCSSPNLSCVTRTHLNLAFFPERFSECRRFVVLHFFFSLLVRLIRRWFSCGCILQRKKIVYLHFIVRTCNTNICEPCCIVCTILRTLCVSITDARALLIIRFPCGKFNWSVNYEM